MDLFDEAIAFGEFLGSGGTRGQVPKAQQQNSPTMTQWSHSRLDSFRQCPRRYQLHYLCEQPEEPMPQLEAGALLHDMIREYGTLCYKAGVDCDSKAARVIAMRAEDQRVQDQFLRFAERQLWNFDGLIGREGELFEGWHEAPLPDDFGQFRARFDWCTIRDGVAEIADWKSGYVYPVQKPEYPPVQLARYGWLLVQEFGAAIEELAVRLEYVGSGAGWTWEVDPGDLVDVEEQLCRDVREVLEYAAKHEGNEWSLNPGSYCSGCGYRRDCAKAASGYLTAPEYPRACIDAIHLYAAGREAANDSLRKHVETYGPHTDQQGLTWGQHEQPTRFEIREGREADFVEALIIGKRKIARHIKGAKLEELADGFDEYLVEKPGGRRWGAKKLTVSDADEQEAESDD